MAPAANIKLSYLIDSKSIKLDSNKYQAKTNEISCIPIFYQNKFKNSNAVGLTKSNLRLNKI